MVDRGEKGIEILQLVMRTPNIHMLLGNHEYMMMQYFEAGADEIIKRRWNRNGNHTTLRGLDRVTEEEKAEILAFIGSLPSQVTLSVDKNRYRLVHGFIGENTHDRVWNRPKLSDVPELNEGERLIVGHTPVCEYACHGGDEDFYVYSRALTQRGEHFRILHAPGFVDVDCCVGYGMSAARLACLRLEDGAEFYVKTAPER